MEKSKIKWYEDEKLAIYFDKMPIVQERYITPFSTDNEIKNIKKCPFICTNGIKVTILDIKETSKYTFNIPDNFIYDGASIPKIFYKIIGANTDNNFLIGSLIHDMLCLNHSLIDYDKSLSTNVFNACLKVAKVNPLKRFLMKNGVALYQTLFCNWDEV